MSDYSKTWIAYANSHVTFKNDSGETVIYSYSNPSDEIITSDFRGEECGDLDDLEKTTFTLTSISLPYVFDFSLETVNSSFPWDAGFGINYDGNTNIPGGLSFSFHVVNDTVNDSPEFIDQISLNGKVFNSVYHAIGNYSTCPVSDCYFTKSLGIIGFITYDGNTWALQ